MWQAAFAPGSALPGRACAERALRQFCLYLLLSNNSPTESLALPAGFFAVFLLSTVICSVGLNAGWKGAFTSIRASCRICFLRECSLSTGHHSRSSRHAYRLF
jgi:hypothetical protein